MTGLEQDRDAVFARICELEAQTAEFRETMKRRRDAERPASWHMKQRVKAKLPRRVRHAYNRFRNRNLPSGAPVEHDLLLDRQTAEERADLYVRPERIAVYSALFGSVDEIQEPMFQPDNIDYFMLTDQPLPADSMWQQMDTSMIPEEFRSNPVLANRWCKMHPQLLFDGTYDYSVYIDANIRVFSDMTPVTAGLDRFPVAMFRHKRRDCVYDEIRACIEQRKDDPGALKAHAALIRSHGIPEHWGLLEASIIARKHADPQCVALMDSWWESFLANSKRDQISLIDCLWLTGLEPAQVGTLGANLQRCNLFYQMRHVK